MAHTFDIRFARSIGLAGLLEAPANPYRWKGTGRLSVDARGISISVRRGVLNLFARGQWCRIASSNLLAVYREGDALRLEYSTQGSSRAVLPVWVTDRNAAAEIVRLLPTQHTVEFEDRSEPGRKYRFDRRFAISLVICAAVLGSSALLLQRYLAPSTPSGEESRGSAAREQDFLQSKAEVPKIDTAVSPVQTSPDANPRVEVRVNYPPAVGGANRASRESEIPSTQATDTVERSAVSQGASLNDDAAYKVSVARASPNDSANPGPRLPNNTNARAQLDAFLTASTRLRAAYIDSTTSSQYQGLEAEWWRISTRIYNSWDFDTPSLKNLHTLQLAVSQSWRRLLASHAQQLSTGYSELLVHEELEYVDSLVDRLRRYEL